MVKKKLKKKLWGMDYLVQAPGAKTEDSFCIKGKKHKHVIYGSVVMEVPDEII